MTVRPVLAGLVAALCALAACNEPAHEPPGATGVPETDSAGITVVTNGPEAVQQAAEWSLSPTPAWVVGDDGAPETALAKVGDVLPLEGGGVAVVTREPPHVLVFDADGALSATLGRRGEGPGEFSWISSAVELNADSLAVLDASPPRLSVFARDGRLLRMVDLRDAVGSLQEAWPTLLRAADGALVLFSVASFGAGRRDVPLYRLSAESSVFDPSGRKLGTLGPFPGQEMFNAQWGFGSAFYGAGTSADVVGDALVVGDGARPELRWYGMDGRLRRIARWSVGPRALGPDAVDSLVEALVAQAPEERRAALRRQMATLPLPDSVPAFGAVLAGDDGRVWVGDYPGPLAAKSMAPPPASRWLVFEPGGTLEATVTSPAGFRPMAVHGGRVWGVYLDELDVETVRAYTVDVTRGAAGS